MSDRHRRTFFQRVFNRLFVCRGVHRWGPSWLNAKLEMCCLRCEATRPMTPAEEAI